MVRAALNPGPRVPRMPLFKAFNLFKLLVLDVQGRPRLFKIPSG
jgi:hypothetical protein